MRLERPMGVNFAFDGFGEVNVQVVEVRLLRSPAGDSGHLAPK